MTALLSGDDYFHTLCDDSHRIFAFRSNNERELRSWQRAFRAQLSAALGIPAIRERKETAFDPQLEDYVELDDHVRENWSIETEPGFRLRFYLLRPLNSAGDRPLVIAAHGHNASGRRLYAGIYDDEDERILGEEEERNIGVQAVRRGYVALLPDMRAFTDGRLKRDAEKDRVSSCHEMQMHALLFGRTLLGERVWDMMRLIDYCHTLSGVDAKKIVMTGNSGGGTVALFASALDERISISIPASYFCTFADSIGSIYHCPCNYVPGMMKMGEMYDIAGLIAPRPFLAVNGKEDSIFPIDATRRAFNQLKKVYDVAGASDACELYEGDGGHRYYKERVWPFVEKWL